jgi:hypothetical protein
MRVIICGSRDWTDHKLIRAFLKTLQKENKELIVIEGEARGADTIAREEAESLGIAVEKYPARWDLYGRAAGPLRNLEMLEKGKPDLIVAFHDDFIHSKGTKDMVTHGMKREIRCIIEPGFSNQRGVV